jgi:hypothetical protein
MSKFTPVKEGTLHGGVFKRYDFPNGYGASVVSHEYSYGGNEGKWELGVLDHNGRLTYETPITSDVIGRLEWPEVEKLLERIAALPEAP